MVQGVGVLQIRRRGLVGDVDGVVQRKVPHGERLEFRVVGLVAVTVFMIDLRQAGAHLAAVRSRAGDDHKRLLHRDVGVASEAKVADDVVEVLRIAGDFTVEEDADAVFFKALFKLQGGRLVVEAGDDDARDVDVAVAQVVDEPQGVVVVGDAEVRADFLAFDVPRMDADDDVRVGGKVLQKPHFDVRVEAGQDARGMEVADELAAELQVEPLAGRADALHDVLGLFLKV